MDSSATAALISAASALAVPFLSAFVSYFAQDDTKRLQAEADTRQKRLEVIEKAFSIVTSARSEHGIDIPSDDIRSELWRILHEFADPKQLSLEALEGWARKSFWERHIQLVYGQLPRFTVPREYVRVVRSLRRSSVAFGLFGALAIPAAVYMGYLRFIPSDMVIGIAFSSMLWGYCMFVIFMFLTSHALRGALRVHFESVFQRASLRSRSTLEAA